MRFNIITNLANGAGLERDYQLARRSLERLGHEVCGVPYCSTAPAPRAEVNLFLEVVAEQFLKAAPRNWVVPNPEWWFAGWDRLFPRFDRVLAKTLDCVEIFKKKGARVEYLGWRSMDLLDGAVPRERNFLHVAGKSQTKNTQAVLEAWEKFRPSPELVVVSDWVRNVPLKNATFLQRVDEAELVRLMNGCLFHLMPSACEGWGHVLHEAESVGALLLTTDAAPMNELAAAVRIPPSKQGEHQGAPAYEVSAEGVAEAVALAWKMTEEEVAARSALARAAFLREVEDFEANLEALVGKA